MSCAKIDPTTAPGAEAALDQSAVAVESGFLFDQSADFRFAAAHGLRERAMPESLGMLEPGHRYFHDRWRSLHARMRILRSDNGETIRVGRRRTKARRGGSAPDEFETRGDHCRRARRSERRRRRSFRAHDHCDSRNGSFNHHRSARSGFSRT